MATDSASIRRLPRDALAGGDYKAFIQPLFGGQYVTQRIGYLEWLLAGNPFLAEEQDLPIFIYQQGGQMLGQLAIIPADLTVHGEEYRGGWCIDFFVSPNAQRQGVGIQLLQAATQDFPLLMTLGQTDLAYRFFIKHGWHACGAMTQWRCIVNLSRTLPKLLMRKLRVTSGRAAQLTSPDPLPDYDRNGLRMRRCTTTEDLEAYVEFASPRSLHIHRPTEFLRWRYLDCPFAEYHLLRIAFEGTPTLVAALRIGELGGWLQCNVVDVMYPDDLPDEILAEFSHALKYYAARCGAEMLECRTSDFRLLRSFGESIFTSQADAQRFMYGMQGGSPGGELSIDECRLFGADCDVDSLAAFQASVGVA
ncbi:MAG: GNAT family N-acetyltransferase [bacterium]|nr:GNAT family N-acetyltransferase [bacterium]